MTPQEVFVSYTYRECPKLYPLTISRGTSSTTKNLFVTVEQGGFTGIGEGAPPSALPPGFIDTAQSVLDPVVGSLPFTSIHQMVEECREREIEPTLTAALETALWDLKAKQAGMPLIDLLGLPVPSRPTCVTIGIEPPDIVRQRVPEIIALSGAKALKVKLGSPIGRDVDKELWQVAKEAAEPFHVSLQADANGGWSPDEAVEMMAWLAPRGCEYVEQPLVKGAEDAMVYVFEHRAMPVFLDESVRTSHDVAKYADRCDGVNLKLMKSGGILEGWRILSTARAHGLGTMIGCFCETKVGTAAAATLSGLCDHVDLDSFLNHSPQIGHGVTVMDGVVTPEFVPGHGGRLD